MLRALAAMVAAVGAAATAARPPEAGVEVPVVAPLGSEFVAASLAPAPVGKGSPAVALAGERMVARAAAKVRYCSVRLALLLRCHAWTKDSRESSSASAAAMRGSVVAAMGD